MGGVFLIGDAAQGAETIVKAIASARRAVDAISGREGGSMFRNGKLPPEDTLVLRSRRDRLVPVSASSSDDEQTRERESKRCLGCRALCMKCVEVCPNRANTMIRVANGFRDEWQILHLDAFCNECGNCATFCPWDGRPYRDKLTIFASEEDLRNSTNQGFFLSAGKGLLRLGPSVREFALDETGSVPGDIGSESVRAVMQTVVKYHPYLSRLGEHPHDRAEKCNGCAPEPADVAAGVDVLIDGTEIAAVGKGAAASVKAERTIDLDGRLHARPRRAAMTTSTRGCRGESSPGSRSSTDFVSTLANLWWRLDRAIDREVLQASGLICALEAVKAGCTAVIDHHASPSYIEGSLATLKGSFEKVGLRGVLCYETTDRNGAQGMEQGVRENQAFAHGVEEERKSKGREASRGSHDRRSRSLHSWRRCPGEAWRGGA